MTLKIALVASILAASSWSNAGAAEPPGLADPEPWRFNLALYGWAMNVSATTTVRNQTIDTNASFIDLVQKSDLLAGLMGYFEADKGRMGVYSDLVFANLGFGADRSAYRNPLPGLSLSARANAALTYQLFIVEIGGVYEAFRWPGSGEGSSTSLDGLLAFRYWNNSIAATLDVSANASINYSAFHLDRTFGIAVARSDVVQWVDPVIGLRLRHQFTPQQQIFVRGDVGGFGLSGSQFSWQAVAAYSYSWHYTGYDVAALVGFRALGVNYSQGSGVDYFAINEVLWGPIIGVSFRF